jgi:hypothetical protein
MAFNWTCPHCNRVQTVSEKRYFRETQGLGISDVAQGSLAFERIVIACANPECRKATVSITIGKDAGGSEWQLDRKRILLSERIIPRGASTPQPDYIPQVLTEDYYEACQIRDLSPKASATLARRCLQGMICDFCGISKSRLIDEIEALKTAIKDGTADRAVTEESVQAIDHVRSLGNIGAHMEKDINLIVPVDPGEAQAMIELIELLFEEWYGVRDRRAKRLSAIAQIATEKDEIKRRATSPRNQAQNGELSPANLNVRDNTGDEQQDLATELLKRLQTPGRPTPQA